MERIVAEINLVSLRKNLHLVRQTAPGRRIMAMVKGNAYGHGMVTIAKALMDVDYLGVASLDEAMALRHAGVMQPIVLTCGFMSKEDLDLVCEHHIEPFVFESYQLDLLAERFPSTKKKKKKPHEKGLNVWLEVNTGMNRLGFSPEKSVEIWRELYLKQQAGLGVESIKWVTHLASSDEENSPQTLAQIELFSVLTEEMGELKSVGNSGAILQYPEAHFDIVRPGKMLYGISPIPLTFEGYQKLFPVMTLKARIIALSILEKGESVGYGAKWTANRPSKIAVVSIGYGDGYPQHAPEGTPVLVRGKIVTLVGQISMDSLTIDVSGLPNVNIHDEVTLWGENLPIEYVASVIGIPPTVLLTGISHRVSRSIVDLET
jgi:alanine racemase